MKNIVYCLILGAAFSSFGLAATEPSPSQMLQQMDYVLRGKSHDMTVSFDVKTETWQRHYKLHVWMKGIDSALARVLEPPKTQGQGFLRIKFRLWNYLPTAERTILIPPSLMLDRFLGSDFSNDDFVRMSYFPRDYDAKILAEEKIGEFDTYHLELIPHKDAPVTYGKLDLWLRKSDSAPVRWDFFNEKMKQIRTLAYSQFKKFGDHEVPTVWYMKNLEKPMRETTVTILEAKYDIEIPDSIFSRPNLEKYP